VGIGIASNTHKGYIDTLDRHIRLPDGRLVEVHEAGHTSPPSSRRAVSSFMA
jgi:hypothetical protein